MEKRNMDIDRRARCLMPGKKGHGPVVYWMARDQRINDNWALLWAQQEALLLRRPLMVVFSHMPDQSGVGLRQSDFMLRGLAELGRGLHRLNIEFHLFDGAPDKTLPSLIEEADAAVLVTDFMPLRTKLNWITKVAERIRVPFYEVDAHNIIPAWIVSDKKEYGAYTIRPKIHRLLDDYLTDFPRLKRHPFGSSEGLCAMLMKKFSVMGMGGDNKVGPFSGFEPGEGEALKASSDFIAHRLNHYAHSRNNPCVDGQSGLSPYLHFGMLSPQRLALEVAVSGADGEACGAFLEELIVRRELADNFCLYEPSYDSVNGFPAWAQKTLQEHLGDNRPYVYNLDELEGGRTHERLWNACQRDLVESGKLHGYLRMYWAKKILEWTRGPDEAMDYAVMLNDRYSLDGCDPNGYAGIAWSIGGVHDRAWAERPIFGKVRYMNERGCRRKFDVEGYIEQITKGGLGNLSGPACKQVVTSD